MYKDLEHPEITCALMTGYPSWMQEDDDILDDENYEDSLYDERREDEMFGDY